MKPSLKRIYVLIKESIASPQSAYYNNNFFFKRECQQTCPPRPRPHSPRLPGSNPFHAALSLTRGAPALFGCASRRLPLCSHRHCLFFLHLSSPHSPDSSDSRLLCAKWVSQSLRLFLAPHAAPLSFCSLRLLQIWLLAPRTLLDSLRPSTLQLQKIGSC